MNNVTYLEFREFQVFFYKCQIMQKICRLPLTFVKKCKLGFRVAHHVTWKFKLLFCTFKKYEYDKNQSCSLLFLFDFYLTKYQWYNHLSMLQNIFRLKTLLEITLFSRFHVWLSFLWIFTNVQIRLPVNCNSCDCQSWDKNEKTWHHSWQLA